jgi:hypothetical protein
MEKFVGVRLEEKEYEQMLAIHEELQKQLPAWVSLRISDTVRRLIMLGIGKHGELKKK